MDKTTWYGARAIICRKSILVDYDHLKRIHGAKEGLLIAAIFGNPANRKWLSIPKPICGSIDNN